MDSIAAEDNPVLGITQPDNGADCKLKYSGMGRPPKPQKDTEPDHTVMRRNIEERLMAMFPRAVGRTDRYQRLSKLSGVGEETIRNIMNGNSSPRLKNIVLIAAAISLTIAELFTPKTAAHKGSKPGQEDLDTGMLQRR